MTDEKQIASKSHKELTNLAHDIYKGKVFTDRSVDDPSILPLVFMPISMGAFSEWKENSVTSIGMLYEYTDKALSRQINGCPMFSSVRVLNHADAEFVCKRVREIEKAVVKIVDDV